MSAANENRPPAVDALARSLAATGLPHPLLVDVARQAIAAGAPERADELARGLQRSFLTPVINATGVLLHTNLGRAPVGFAQPARAQTVEFDLATGERGSRHRAVGQMIAKLCGTEAAIIVNNNAAAVLLVLATLAAGRGVAVSRGESVEIGGSFRVPEVIAQSGCRLVDVGTTNRTRRADYERAIADGDIAAVLKVHPSNYRVEGFIETVPVGELAALDVPVIVDIGSGLIDAKLPWLKGPPPTWLAEEPAARQTIAAGADIVTFSGDKLFGGPQAGLIVGRADLVERCARHPLARALRCGGLVLAALQQTALSYLHRRASTEIALWRMVATSPEELQRRATRIIDIAGVGSVVRSEAVPGAGSAPGMTIASVAIAVPGDHLEALRSRPLPIIARTQDDVTTLDLASVEAADDDELATALHSLATR